MMMMMVKCRCILHEFSITTSTSTTKMMMIITMATMLINKRNLCQPQNRMYCVRFCAGCVGVCCALFDSSRFFFFIFLFIHHNLFCSRSRIGERVNVHACMCICGGFMGWCAFSFSFSFSLLSSLQFQPNYIVAMYMFAFFAFCITCIFYDRIYVHMQNSHVYVAH